VGSFNVLMRANFLQRDVHLPALDEPAQDLQLGHRGIRAEQGARLELARRITDQYPADGDRRFATVGYSPT
jgi:hypothetical protein